jgi:hypothetical protein
MSRPTLEVADILRAHADNFINKHDLRFVNTAALTVRNQIEEVAEKPETLSDFSATFF